MEGFGSPWEWPLLIAYLVFPVLVYVDAKRLGAGTHDQLRGFASSSAGAWAAAVLLLGVFGLLLYVVVRPKIAAAARVSPHIQPVAPSMRRCAVCDQLYALEYDGCPHCARSQPPTAR